MFLIQRSQYFIFCFQNNNAILIPVIILILIPAVISWPTWATFKPKPEKIEKKSISKNFLYFRKRKFLAFSFFLYFKKELSELKKLKKKNILKKFLIFILEKWNFIAPNFLASRGKLKVPSFEKFNFLIFFFLFFKSF